MPNGAGVSQWLDPDLRYRRAWELLLPGGHLAFWSATHVFSDDPFFDEIQDVYDEICGGMPTNATQPRRGDLPDNVAEIESSGLFHPLLVREFDWEIDFETQAYLRLLNTFSNHIVMQERHGDRLYQAIRMRLAKRSNGTLSRGWGAVLHVAKRIDSPWGLCPPGAATSNDRSPGFPRSHSE